MDDMKATETEDDDVSGNASDLEDAECFLKLRDWFKEDSDKRGEWLEDAKEDYDFVAGHQWTDDEKKTLRDQMRPAITFNRIAPVIDSVAGTEVSNRQEVRYLPRTEGDVQVDEVLTAAGKWFRDECEAEDEESDAFQDVLICGEGWTETRLDYELEEEGAPLVDRIDPFEIYPDSGSRKRNYSDARRVFRVRDIPIEDARALVPGAADEDFGSPLSLAGSGSPEESREEARWYRPGANDEQQQKKGNVTIIECQWWERETVYLVADPMTGEVQELDDDAFETLQERAPEIGMPVKAAPVTRRKYYRAYLGRTLLMKEESPFQGHFSYKAITGKRDRNKGSYFGLVRQMKDPQRWANKWLSQTLHIMNVNAKGGIMAEDGVAEDMREFEKNWARPDAVTRVKQGTLSSANGPKIQPKPGAQFPAGYFQLMEFAISSIRDSSGVNLELLGLADRQQAGVLEAQRKKAAMAILATLFDSLRRYRKSQGKLLLQIITEHLSDGRLIRIVGEEGEKYVPLVRQEGLSKFDVKVDDSPTSQNQREVTWELLSQIIPAVKDLMSPDIWSAILPYSPLPSNVSSKLQKIIADGQQANAASQQDAQQIARAKAIAEVNKEQSTANLNEAKAIAEGYSANADLIQALTQAMQPPQMPQ